MSLVAGRIVDRGAVTAAYVGIGMALTIVISFVLIIPLGAGVLLLLAPVAGLIIGYYANQRSNRIHGPWGRMLANGLFAGVATGLTFALLLLGLKALFFYGDNGWPDYNRVDQKTGQAIPPFCENGAGCVYARYLALGEGPDFEAAGVTDAASFTPFYWNSQFQTAGVILVLTMVGGLGGAAAYGLTRPKPRAPEGTVAART